MPLIDRETVSKILDTADIVEVVSDFVNLKRSGANYMGLCPFHNERTPSFSVSKAKQVCKCFSCGKGGTAVGFIMEHEQLSYGEALRWLANKYNIEIKERELTPEELAAATERESMLALNEFALQFFEHTLTDNPAGRAIGLSYFRERGLSDAAIKRFRLGYAPEERDALSRRALAKGYTDKLLTATGLCSKSERGTLYDRFRGRVIFPVFSLSGKVLAFGGRTLQTSKEVAKYVNSPESTVYHKSNELYGLYQARRAIVQKNKCILVEGYMDVISMSQRGVENVVASSGTSLTEGQIALIHRFTPNVTVIYDSDAAGIKASLRGIDMLLAQGMNIKVMLLPEGEDPDSFAKSHSLDEIEDYFKKNETDFIRFKTRILLDSLPEGDPVGRAGVINSIAASIAVIPDRVVRSEYIKECSRLMETDEQIVRLQVAKYASEHVEKVRAAEVREQARAKAVAADPTVATVPVEAAKTDDRAAYLRAAETEVVRLLARHGLCSIGSAVNAEGDSVPVSVCEYIAGEFADDDITLSNPDLEKTYLAVAAAASLWQGELATALTEAESVRQSVLLDSRSEILAAQSVEGMHQKEKEIAERAEAAAAAAIADASERFLTRTLGSDPDADVRRLSTAFVSEKYTLSKIHTKGVRIASERDQLGELAPRALYSLKIAILQWNEKQLRAALANPGADLSAIFNKLQETRALIAEIARYLGDRIILPK